MFDVGLADLARRLVVAGLMTAFGVALGALLRLQVATVAGVLIWALAIEPIIAVIRPKVGTWLPFTVFNQVTGGRARGRRVSIGLERPAGVPRERRLYRDRQRRGGAHLHEPRRHLTQAAGAGGVKTRACSSLSSW